MTTDTVRTLPPPLATALPALIQRLAEALGDNLASVVVYGSAARGDWNPAESDINLLIVLQRSTPEAHAVLGPLLGQSGLRIEPFVLGQHGLSRSVRAFATKFLSIRRSSILLHGTDLLAAIPDDAAWLRALSEQALRNLRLRAVQAYLRSGGEGGRYAIWVESVAGRLLSELTTAARLAGWDVQGSFEERAPALAECFGLERADLDAVVAAHHTVPTIAGPEAVLAWHRRLYGLLDQVLLTLEGRWLSP